MCMMQPARDFPFPSLWKMSVSRLGVKHYGGEDHRLEVNLAKTTVRDLKLLLAPETNLPVDDQILVYNAKTLSDTQTLTDAGITNDRYKVILGSKSHDPTGRPESCPSIPSAAEFHHSHISTRMMHSLDNIVDSADIKKLTTVMWHDLKQLAEQVSVEHLEQVAGIALKEHEEWLQEKKDNYLKCFLDNHRKQVENDRRNAEEKARKTKELLAAEAAAET